jgi:nicotinamide riboside kinase
MKKVAITGPECSGKSTLAMFLATKLGTNWIPEAARMYLERLGRPYEQKDLDVLAQRQQLMIDSPTVKEVKIVDTEMLVLKIWSIEKYGNVSALIETLWMNQDFDLYILCKPDMPYEEDELRENPNDRDRLFDIYQAALIEKGVNFIVSQGTVQDRVSEALNAIEQL